MNGLEKAEEIMMIIASVVLIAGVIYFDGIVEVIMTVVSAFICLAILICEVVNGFCHYTDNDFGSL